MTVEFSKRNLIIASAAAFAAFVGFGPTPADAQFYKGKTITMLVPVPGGSGLDLIARNFAKFWASQIPGKPTIVTKNVPGGGGIKSLNFMYDKGRPDGLTVNYGPWNAGGVVGGAPGIRFKPEEFGFVGASHSPQTTIIRKDIGSGLKSSADIVKVGKFKIGGRGPTRPLDLAGNLALDIIGAKYIYVPGYRGMAKIKPAIFANEVQAGHSGYTGYSRFFKDTLIKDGKALALWYHSDFDENGNPVNNPAVTDFKSFHEVYKEVHGKLPSGPKWQAYKWVRTVEASMALTVFAAKGIPKQALADLSKAYYSLAKDKAFLASTVKTSGVQLGFTPHDVGLNVLKTFRNISPEIKAVFAEMAKKGSN